MDSFSKQFCYVLNIHQYSPPALDAMLPILE